MVMYVVGAIAAAIWVYLLHVLSRAELWFWRFMVGSMGLFILLMIFVRPWAVEPLAHAVAAIAGVFGSLTGSFETYIKYGVIFVNSASGSITLQVDFECSGIIEIMAFVSLLTFFRVYTPNERILVGILGSLFITLANVLRIIIVCEIIHFGGVEMYYMAHSLIGRIVFYVLSILLYFYVFTKQIGRASCRERV